MALDYLVDSYASLEFVTDYWTSLGNTDWTGLDEADQEINIRKATLYIDRNYRFVGRKKTGTQPLEWPRILAQDLDGYLLDDSEAPLLVMRATAVVANLYRQGTVDLDPIITDDDIAVEEVKVDVIEVKYRAEDRQKSSNVVLPDVDNLLGPLLVGARLRRA